MKSIKGMLALAVIMAAVFGCSSPSAPKAPEVLTTSPRVGSTGVGKEAKIVIYFSEPMDISSVEAAYESNSDGIKPDQVSFSWEDGDKKLVITPNAPLAYSPNARAIKYKYMITRAAKSKEGVHLAADFEGSFSTMRTVSITIKSSAALDGQVRSDGQVANDTEAAFVGEDFEDLDIFAVLPYFSFSLEELPSNLEEIISANLRFYVVKHYGIQDYSYRVELVDYGDTLDRSDYSLIAEDDKAVSFAELSWTEVAVTNWVQGRFNDGAEKFQVRANFNGAGEMEKNGYDLATAEAESGAPELVVSFYAP